jgi:hypothetical protein
MRLCALFDTEEFGEIISETPEAYTIRLFKGETVTASKADVWVLT